MLLISIGQGLIRNPRMGSAADGGEGELGR